MTLNDWNLILGTIVTVVGIIVSVESYYGWFTYPPLWIGYSILVLISGVFIYRSIFHKPPKDEPYQPPIEPPEKPKPKLDLDRLPEPTTKLVGREAELAQLDENLKDPKKAIVAMIAAGGVGKTALIWEWLQHLQPDYGGATRVFSWSFYNQGSQQKLNSSAPFFEAALPFFDYEGTIPKDEIEKAKALAECLRDHYSLLILDGLESLQHPVQIQNGELTDVALKELFRRIHKYGLGEAGDKNLVIMTTRQPVVELDNWNGYEPIDLNVLSNQAGAALLQSLNVKGKPEDLEAASKDMGGHALGLILMGQLVVERFQGDIQCRDQLTNLFEDTKEGQYALSVLRYYDNDFWQSDGFLQRVYHQIKKPVVLERILLRLMGLFERPMGLKEKEVLLEKADYAKPLAKLEPKEWQQLEQRLEQAGLLLKPDQDGPRNEWDTHPIIRRYFGETFRQDEPKAYQQAQQVLFEYYQTVPKNHQPDLLENLEPLYRSVVHGCLAGEYQKAWQEVYIERICRGEEYYSTKKLGAYAHDLTALSAFFPEGWEKPVDNGSEKDSKTDDSAKEKAQALLLNQVSLYLMSLGRLFEAIKPRQKAIEIAEQHDKGNAAVSARNLVDLHLLIGPLEEAETVARKSLTFSKKTNDNNRFFSQMASHAKLGTVLHRQGRLKEALEQFTEAEELQAKHKPESPQLCSVWGFQYCNLLLNQTTGDEAQAAILERGQYALEIAQQDNQLLDKALDCLTIARTQNVDPSEHLTRFDEAVDSIRKASKMNYLPIFLLARAKFLRDQQEYQAAQRDLDESLDTIQTCGMKLFAVDSALLQGNLYLDQGSTANECYKTAKNLIDITGYHLRDPELNLLGARIAFSDNDSDNAQLRLQKVRQRLEEMDYWGLLPAWERVKQEFESK
jgi:tetratricopeptide (TPR) repeat protein